MMVLIMTNINHLVILISSIVFLLSSFVSSQQKPKNYEDPGEFYNYALYVRNNYPQYYAVHYPSLLDQYKRLISATEAKRNILNRETSKHNRQLKQNVGSNSAGPKIGIQVDGLSRSPHRTPLVNNSVPLGKEFKENTVRTYRSRSLNKSPKRPEDEAFTKATREISDNETTHMNTGRDWAHYCFTLGYNSTNISCHTNPYEHIDLDSNEIIKRAPNRLICRVYFTIGWQFRYKQELCAAGANVVIEKRYDICKGVMNRIDIHPHGSMISFHCCYACKRGIARSEEICDMQLDSSMPSYAHKQCCENYFNRTKSVAAINPTTMGSMDAMFAETYGQLSKI